MGNAFTFGTDEIGSLTKIQADNTACGGATSTGLTDIKGWTSVASTLVDVSAPAAALGL